MPTISNFTTKGKTSKEIAEQLTDAGADIKLPFVGKTQLSAAAGHDLENIPAEQIKDREGNQQVITSS